MRGTRDRAGLVRGPEDVSDCLGLLVGYGLGGNSHGVSRLLEGAAFRRQA
jgi:hypothetical protein